MERLAIAHPKGCSCPVHAARPTTRSTPVPGHRRGNPYRGSLEGWQVTCACGWVSWEAPTADAVIDQHTKHKAAVRSGEWAALFEADARADVLSRAEPFDLIDDVQARIDERNAALAERIHRRTT